MIPFLNHGDLNVQFFGAHTAQVKITRDWCVSVASVSFYPSNTNPRASFPEEHATDLRDMILDVTGRAMGSAKNKVILRKLYVAVCVCSLAKPDRLMI